MSNPVLDELKQRVPISLVAGTTLRRCECPFCGSKSGMKINHLTNSWRCYSCDRWGSQIDWLVARDHVSIGDAIQTLADMIGISLKPNRERQEVLRKVASICRDAFPTYPRAVEAMTKRGFKQEFLFSRNVGYCNWEVASKLIREVGLETLVDARLVYQDGTPYYKDHVIIPVKNTFGEINNLQGRALFDTDLKYLAMPKESKFGTYSIQSHLYNEEALKAYANQPNSYVFVAEGVPDTWSLLQAGLNAVGLLGNSTIKFHTRKFQWIKSIFLILDNDKATNEKLLDQVFHLQLGCPEATIRVIKLPQPPEAEEDKRFKVDVNDWFAKHGGTTDKLRRMCAKSPLAMDLLLSEWAGDHSRHEYLFLLLKAMPEAQQQLWFERLSEAIGISVESLAYTASVVADLHVTFKRGK